MSRRLPRRRERLSVRAGESGNRGRTESKKREEVAREDGDEERARRRVTREKEAH